MRPQIAITPAADQDLQEEASYIGGDSPVAAARFLVSAAQAFRDLARMPRIGSACAMRNPGLRDLRMWRVPGFERFLIFYRPIEGGVEVVRILHGARDVRRILEAEDS